MKYKFYILLLSALMCLSFGLTTVKAESETTDIPVTTEAVTVIPDNQETTTISEEVTTKEPETSSEKTTVKRLAKKPIKKEIKVNQTCKIKKLLKIKNSKLKKFSFKTSNKKVAKVSKKGVITGVKKGNAVISVISKSDDSVCATIKITVKDRYTASDLRLMAAIINSEAEGECYAGKKAVGIVVMNRVKSKDFPNTIKGVIYQKGQFTPTTNGSLNKSLALYDKGKLNKSCIKAAKAVLNGDTTVKYRNKKYNLKGYLFFSRYVYNCRLKIQNHQFK